ncbi:MAG: hypothetical protein RIR18_798 [Pseudomonadota bacterium]|jgi:GT2 family glycosyltransferase/glycosyltransferase involved in cell wall biosynthesis
MQKIFPRISERVRSIHGSTNVPFYIYAPSYRQSSAGIRALHYLCHILNELGEEAYLANAVSTPEHLRTPMLTEEIVCRHFSSGRTPIAVYPEVFGGNPLNTPLIARWLLNKPGKVGQSIHIDETDLVFYFDQWSLPEGIKGQELFISTLDGGIFNNDANEFDNCRIGSCYYANKYYFSGGTILEEHQQSTSLGQEVDLTSTEIAAILRRSQVLYCYEPSALISEAIACGCPVIFVRSPYWPLPPNDSHLLIEGTGIWGEKDALLKAQNSIAHNRAQSDFSRTSWVHAWLFVQKVYQAHENYLATVKPVLHPNTAQDFWSLNKDARQKYCQTFKQRLHRLATADDLYDSFLNRKSLQEIDGQLLAEHMHQWRTQPVFNVIVEVLAGEENLLADTLDSLGAQWYSHWHMTIVADFPPLSPELVEIEQITWIECSSSQHTSFINNAALREESNWLCLLEAGCTLEPHALASFGDTLNLYPEARLIYCDEDKSTGEGHSAEPRFKPDFNLEFLRGMYYFGPCLFVEKSAFSSAGGLSYTGMAGLYDLSLKIAESQPSHALVHLPEILLHTPEVGLRTIDPDTEQSALRDHFKRQLISTEVTDGFLTGTQAVIYSVTDNPLVSIVIPTHDQPGYLTHCIESLLAETAYANVEIVLLNHQTTDSDALLYLEELRSRPTLSGRIKVLRNDDDFNYAALCNQGALASHGEYILFLDNDSEFIQKEWLSRLIGHIQQRGVAAVSPRMSCPDGNLSILNQGPRILGLSQLAGPMAGDATNIIQPGYFGNLQVAQEVSALSGSCFLVRKDIYNELGGFNTNETPVHEPVLEFCLRLRKAGHKLIWTPWVDVIHRNKITRNRLAGNPDMSQKINGHKQREQDYLLLHYMPELANDPFYHRHLSLNSPFEIEPHAVIDWDTRFHDRLRVLGMPLTSASGEYRMLAPFRALQKAGLAQCCQVHPVGEKIQRVLTPIELARAAPDTLMIQQAIDDVQIAQMKRYRQFNKDIFVTYAVDDIMGNLPKKHHLYNFQAREGKSRLREAIALSDRLIVSTEPIAIFCKGMIDHIHIVPNRLEGSRWLHLKSKRRAGQKPRVGWAGAQQHLGDLELIKEVVEATHQEVEWVFMGMCPDFLKPFIQEEHNYVSFNDYPEKLASLNLDLAIAPLEQVVFNEGKSNLRLLEYGIMGWPVVCTDVFPYRTNNPPVKCVQNKTNEWVDAIRARIYDLDAAEKEGDRLREWVLKHYILEDHLDEWMSAIGGNAAILRQN